MRTHTGLLAAFRRPDLQRTSSRGHRGARGRCALSWLDRSIGTLFIINTSCNPGRSSRLLGRDRIFGQPSALKVCRVQRRPVHERHGNNVASNSINSSIQIHKVGRAISGCGKDARVVVCKFAMQKPFTTGEARAKLGPLALLQKSYVPDIQGRLS